jgi:hypothetical protein
MRRITYLRTPLVLASASVALLVAGCGANSPSPTTGGGGPSGSGDRAAYTFSRCMRQHGVANFPDPIVTSNGNQHSVIVHITPALNGSPQFKTAQHACRGILPGPGKGNVGGLSPQQVAARVKGRLGFATCMRAHQVPTFPDPTSQGQLNLAMVRAAGINLHAPAVVTAARACVSASGGQITAAQVAQATGSGSATGSASAGG